MDIRDSDRFSPRAGRLLSRVLAIGFLGSVAVGLFGCDTVALITFQDRNFDSIESPGFTAPAGMCGASEGDLVFRYVLLADDSTAIRPNEPVGRTEVEVTSDKFSVSETNLFSLPEASCSEASDCPDGFQCGKPVPASPLGKRCFISAGMQVKGQPEFDSDLSSNQLFGVVYEHSGSLEGWLPSDVGNLNPDYDEDGTAEGADDPGPKGARASDPTGDRKAAAETLEGTWETVAENAKNDGRATRFGLWQFSGTSTAGVTSWVAEAAPNDTQLWTAQAGTARNAVRLFRDVSNSVSGTRANVYQALVGILEDAYAADEFAGNDKTLVLFVDGPDDLRNDQFTADRVIDLASENDVRIFIVHLDPPLDTETDEETPLFRDDPRYYQGQDGCEMDTDCKNFERCREATGYSNQGAGTPVTQPPPMYKVCLPHRGPNGRIGPIEDYARIACETDGGYIYVNDAASIDDRSSWLPFTMDGLWKMTMTLDQFELGAVPEDEGYKLMSNVQATIAGENDSVSFSEVGSPLVGVEPEKQDTRAAVFYK